MFSMKDVHMSGVELVEFAQKSFPNMSEAIVNVSWIGDPRFAFLVYFPIMFAIHWPTGIRMLWAAVIAEWVNHVLKWVLYGERPYWWVNENGNLWTSANLSTPLVKQFHITCETGPGSPSGHMMIAAATWFVAVYYFSESRSSKPTSRVNRILSMAVWSLYFAWVLAVGVSRVFVGAHFPHQCVAGLIAGVILGYLVNKLPIENLNLRSHFVVATFLLSTALAAYFALRSLGLDPMWTFPLAVKWCAEKSWVHATTSPFYTMWRYVGTILGIGLGLHSPLYKGKRVECRLCRYISASVSLMIALAWDKFHPQAFYLSYGTCFLKSLLVPVLVIAVVPWVIAKLVSTTKKNVKKKLL